MAQRFAYATLLRLREAEEEQQETLLKRAAHHVQELRDLLVNAIQERRNQSQMCREALERGTSAAEMLWREQCLVGADRSVEQLNIAVNRAEQILANQQVLFRQARQKREVLTTLRDQHAESARLADAKREQQQQDEIFLIRKLLEQDEQTGTKAN